MIKQDVTRKQVRLYGHSCFIKEEERGNNELLEKQV